MKINKIFKIAIVVIAIIAILFLFNGVGHLANYIYPMDHPPVWFIGWTIIGFIITIISVLSLAFFGILLLTFLDETGIIDWINKEK